MGNNEEQYLDNLLKSVMGQDAAEIMENAARQNKEEQKTIAEEDTGVDFVVPEEETEQIEEPVVEDIVEEGNMSDELKLEELGDELNIDDIEGLGDELKLEDLDLDLEGFGDDIKLDDIELPDLEPEVSAVEEAAMEEPAMEEPTVWQATTEEPGMEESVVEEPVIEEPIVEEISTEEPVIEEPIVEEISTEEPVMEEAVVEEPSQEEVKLEELNIEELGSDEPVAADTPGTETEMEVSIQEDELLDDIALDDIALDDMPSIEEEEDSDLSEINDLLKKSDSNEPIAEEDDMMKLLEQIADDEEAFVDAEDKDKETKAEKAQEEVKAESIEEPAEGKKAKKKKEKKVKKETAETTPKEPKKKGVFGKLFDTLTEDLVPEPTEEELAKEAEEKKAKKEADKAKKEEAKAAKAEEKKAKDEEKAAAKKAKEEAAAAKKKEKEEAKAEKLAAKKAKEEAEAPKKKKRISPKKLLLVAIFAGSVFAIVMIFTNMISTEGMLQRARKAYYAGDYATAYQELYGEELDASDTLVKERSRIILTMQRKYDSYENHIKMHDELKALDSLITGVQTYYLINAEAEEYGCLDEVKSIKTDIVSILTSNYDITEQDALDLLQNEDEISYTKSLNDIIMRTNSGTTGYASGSD